MSDTNRDERDVTAEDPLVNEEGNDEVRIPFWPSMRSIPETPNTRTG